MHVRIKITLLFTMIMFLLLALLCGSVYFFSYKGRLNNIRTRISNRASVTAHMLQEPGVFDKNLMNKIDSASIFALRRRTIQAYNNEDKKIYSYNDIAGDTLNVKPETLRRAKEKRAFFFSYNNKDAVISYDAHSGISVLVSTFDEQGKKHLQDLEIVLWLCLSGGILIALLSGYFFSKALLRPIKQIADDVNSISAHSLTKRIKAGPARDEWNYLVETLNDLLNRLEEGFEIQRRFISVASHELSTPLTAISSQLEISLQKDRDATAYMQVMQSVYQDVRHLSQLTQTLLEFAAVSGNAGGIELTPVRIDEVLMRLPAEITKSHNEYSIKLEFDELPNDETKLLVFGNAELLFTAIKNIVVNACKYSLNKLAKVKLIIEDANIIVSIEDNGKGIPENELQNIFQPFYRTEDSRQLPGFGIGLPLVNRIVRLHKGWIKIKSVVGTGTTFFIILPITTNAPGK